MIIKPSWYQLQRWIEEPAKGKPKPPPDVEIILIGLYLVTGSKGAAYEVRIGITGDDVDDDGECFAACTCKGNLHRMACRHIKAVWPVHKELAEPEIIEEFI